MTVPLFSPTSSIIKLFLFKLQVLYQTNLVKLFLRFITFNIPVPLYSQMSQCRARCHTIQLEVLMYSYMFHYTIQLDVSLYSQMSQCIVRCLRVQLDILIYDQIPQFKARCIYVARCLTIHISVYIEISHYTVFQTNYKTR